MFSEGREDVNDEERAGRPSTSTTDEKINEVEKMILANRRITVREVAEDLNISIGSCHSIFFNDLGMRRVATKFVSKLLNCDQKQHRMNIANEMLDSVRDDPNLLQRIITGDEAYNIRRITLLKIDILAEIHLNVVHISLSFLGIPEEEAIEFGIDRDELVRRMKPCDIPFNVGGVREIKNNDTSPENC
ncbi:hypothetical protein LAZ67_11003273 [Cordylochernes scorpioides]|uniref:Uncharacterized protein n=1 Tax=Cordylochernes scorpioides TaxID=51811 RepID=A0ABY6KZR8_9ARAC|nr:hypothetical protein LAZ67_11003273 [Cordylochernes scorpioides]